MTVNNKISKAFCFSRIALSFVLIDLIVKIFAALKPIKYIDGILIPDDAYLSLTISRNIAKGLAPLYGSEFTNGFQPLYVFLIAPVYVLLPHDYFTPIHIALVILAFFDALTLLFLFKLLWLYTQKVFPLLFLGISWLLSVCVLRNSINGLETCISVFFIVVTVYYFCKLKKENGLNNPNLLKIGILCGLAMFARIDNVFLFASVCLVFVFSKESSFKGAIALLFGAVIAISPWLLYMYAYGLEVIPLSGKAVRYVSLAQVSHKPTWENWYLKSIESALAVIWANSAAHIVVLVLLTLLMIFFYKKTGKKEEFPSSVALLILISAFMFVAYTMYIFTFWFFGRYLYPVTLLFLVSDLLLMAKLSESRLNKRFFNLIGAIILAVVLAGSVYKDNVVRIYLARYDQNWVYANVGLWCRENFKDGTAIGSSQTGAIGYFADNLKVVNLDGVVNSKCYESMVNKRYVDYIKEQNIQYILGWPENIRFIKNESSNFKESDLRLIGTLPGLQKSIYRWFVYKVNY